MKFHHLGIACRDIAKTKEWVKCRFPVISEGTVIFDPLQEAQVLLLSLKDGSAIELISGKPVEDFLKRGIHLYHSCFVVKDIHKVIEEFKKDGAVVVSSAKEAVLFNQKKVAFLLTPIGIIELLEE